MKIFINNKIYNQRDAKISVIDSSFLWGYSAFTTLVAVKNKIQFIDDHIDRLFKNCKNIKLKLIWTKKQVKNILLKTLKQTKYKNARIRLAFTNGDLEKITFRTSKIKSKPKIIIIIKKIKQPKLELNKSISLKTVKTQRQFAEIKQINFIPSILAWKEAQEKGYDDGLMVDQKNNILEASTANIFCIKNNIIKTPKNNVLLGVTRKYIIKTAKELDYKVKEGNISIKELKSSNEVFITNTTTILRIINKIDNKIINKTPTITKKIENKFLEKYY